MKLTVLVFIAAALLCAQTADLPLMPWPEKLTRSGGVFPVDADFGIVPAPDASPRVRSAIQRALAHLTAKTGLLLPGPSAPSRTLEVRYRRATPRYPELGADESYRLVVTDASARLEAETDLGALHGLQTFLQLVSTTASGFGVPAVIIEDRPRFPWRGLLLDVARHWMPMPVLKRTLDGMAAVKMNVFQLHLSDNQGFRVESKRYSKLHELGSDGLYFTQAELREIVDYAADRGIRVLPEFDIPGHTTSWLVGYPEIGTAPGPYTVNRKWGVQDPTLDPTKEETYSLLDGFIGEMAAIFPDAYFHIGGDEVNGKDWNASLRVQQFRKTNNLKDNHDVQVQFNKRLLQIVTKHGKRMVGWDEVLHPELPKNIVVHSWRGQKSLADAARQGYQGILSNGYYLDLMHSAAQHYAVDPLEGATAGLSADEKGRVLGGQACLWTEYVSPEVADARIWPRNAAIAERLWSPQSVKDPASMYTRLAAVSRHLVHLGLNHRSSYRPMLERIANGADIEPVKIVADVVESVKNYDRAAITNNGYTQQTPLNRLVDAARSESDTAREFGDLVTAHVQRRDAGAVAGIREWLTLWRDNDKAVQQMLGRSHLMKEVGAVSAELAAVAALGLEALDGKSSRPAALERLKAAEKPRAEVLVMIVPHVRRLVEASSSQ